MTGYSTTHRAKGPMHFYRDLPQWVVTAAAYLGLVMAVSAPALSASPIVSQIEKRYTVAYNQCLGTGDAAAGITVAIVDCVDAETERQDARLNEAYRIVMTGLSGAQKIVLRASERKWISDRTSRCTKSAESEGGTLGNIIYADCILNETVKRTIWLENYKP